MAKGKYVYLIFASIDQEDPNNQPVYSTMVWNLANGDCPDIITDTPTSNPPIWGYKFKVLNINDKNSVCNVQIIREKDNKIIGSLELSIDQKRAKKYSFAPELQIVVNYGIFEVDLDNTQEVMDKLNEVLGYERKFDIVEEKSEPEL